MGMLNLLHVFALLPFLPLAQGDLQRSPGCSELKNLGTAMHNNLGTAMHSSLGTATHSKPFAEAEKSGPRSVRVSRHRSQPQHHLWCHEWENI